MLGLISALAIASSPAVAAGRRVEVNASALLSFGQRLEAAGRAERAADVYRALVGDSDSNVRSEARFRLARMMIADGRKTEAAVLLRHVIDDHPMAAPPRLALVGLLQQLGDEASALRELRVLSTLDLPLNIGRLVDRMSASLKASQPLAFQLELALAPDSNINRATSSDTLGTVLGSFSLDDGSKARSGVGAAVRGFAQGRVNLSSRTQLKAYASLDASLYRHRDFNDISLDLGAGPELALGPVRLAVQAGTGQQYYGMHPYQRTFRVSGSAWLKVESAAQLRIDGAFRWADNQFNDLQDGRGFGLGARYERALSSRLSVSVGAQADRFVAKDDAYSTRSWTLGAKLYRDVGRTTLEIGGEIGGLTTDERLALLPQAREDHMSKFHIGAVFRQFTVAGFAPTMRFTVERNRSTVEYYDYRRTRMEFGVSRAF